MKEKSTLTRFLHFSLVAEIAFFAVPFISHAQNTNQAQEQNANKDTLIFKNGEKLIGKLQRSTGDTVLFQSEVAGDVKVTWSDIQELHSANRFALVEKGVKLRTNESDARIPQGTVSMADESIALKTTPQGPPTVLPLANIADVIDESTFDKVVLSRPAWYQNWKGSGTLGLAIVNGTQTSQSYTSAVNFIRDIPGENWMDPESRTILSFNSSYGELNQPLTPSVKTSIFHAQAERDRYISSRLYLFAQAGFDHDYSQGLDLQQTFGGGLGWSTLKSAGEQLDLRAALVYEDQNFFLATQDQHLASSIFSESYNRKFENKITFHEALSITPSWTNSSALSTTGEVSLTIPIVKRLSYTLGSADTFLNNPSPGFRKNSFQFSSGITYTMP